jgi:hypothetical protein
VLLFPLVGVQGAQSIGGNKLLDWVGVHNDSLWSLRAVRNFCMANLIRVLTVPNGCSNWTAISDWLNP